MTDLLAMVTQPGKSPFRITRFILILMERNLLAYDDNLMMSTARGGRVYADAGVMQYTSRASG